MWRPQNHKELFNLHDTQLQKVIEQIFGIVKRCFKVLLLVQEYTIQTQAQLVGALAVLHNFIRVHNLANQIDEDNEDLDEDIDPPCHPHCQHNLGQPERERVDNCQEQIALDMWANYLCRWCHN